MHHDQDGDPCKGPVVDEGKAVEPGQSATAFCYGCGAIFYYPMDTGPGEASEMALVGYGSPHQGHGKDAAVIQGVRFWRDEPKSPTAAGTYIAETDRGTRYTAHDDGDRLNVAVFPPGADEPQGGWDATGPIGFVRQVLAREGDA